MNKNTCYIILYIIVLITLSSLLVGCATVTRGSKDILIVNSVPSGAKVTTSTGLTGTTPCSFKVSRKGGFVVTIEKPGYESASVQVNRKLRGGGTAGMAGNVIFGGLVGSSCRCWKWSFI